MRQFQKGDTEYISNGNYLIEGVNFMSIWAFKNLHRIKPNEPKINRFEGGEMTAHGVRTCDSKPDFGQYDVILIYPVSDLEEYYNI